MELNKSFTYDPKTGSWHFNLPKAYKDIHSQSGIQIIIDPGLPTGGTAPIYQTKEQSGLKNASLEIRAFDNLAGWVSVVNFDLSTLLEKLIEIMPQDKIKYETFLLAQRDLETMKNRKENEDV